MLSEITPSALQSGYGEKVCIFLNALADVALVVTKHSWQQAKYTGVEAADNDKDDALGDLDDGGIDDLAEIGDASEGSMGVLEEDLGASATDYTSERFMAGSLIVPSVDPKQWREEMERVSSVLTSTMVQVKRMGNEWRDRVHALSSFLGEGRLNYPKEVFKHFHLYKCNRYYKTENTLLFLLQALPLIGPFKIITENIVSMKRELLEATESVSRVEKLINSRANIDAFNREYSTEKQVFDSTLKFFGILRCNNY
jgi:hypothetical protein